MSRSAAIKEDRVVAVTCRNRNLWFVGAISVVEKWDGRKLASPFLVRVDRRPTQASYTTVLHARSNPSMSRSIPTTLRGTLLSNIRR